MTAPRPPLLEASPDAAVGVVAGDGAIRYDICSPRLVSCNHTRARRCAAWGESVAVSQAASGGARPHAIASTQPAAVAARARQQQGRRMPPPSPGDANDTTRTLACTLARLLSITQWSVHSPHATAHATLTRPHPHAERTCCGSNRKELIPASNPTSSSTSDRFSASSPGVLTSACPMPGASLPLPPPPGVAMASSATAALRRRECAAAQTLGAGCRTGYAYGGRQYGVAAAR